MKLANVALSAPFECTMGCGQEQGQEHLIPKLTRSFGHGMGLEMRDNSTSISSKSSVTLRSGMVFNLSIGDPSCCCCLTNVPVESWPLCMHMLAPALILHSARIAACNDPLLFYTPEQLWRLPGT